MHLIGIALLGFLALGVFGAPAIRKTLKWFFIVFAIVAGGIVLGAPAIGLPPIVVILYVIAIVAFIAWRIDRAETKKRAVFLARVEPAKQLVYYPNDLNRI